MHVHITSKSMCMSHNDTLCIVPGDGDRENADGSSQSRHSNTEKVVGSRPDCDGGTKRERASERATKDRKTERQKEKKKERWIPRFAWPAGSIPCSSSPPVPLDRYYIEEASGCVCTAVERRGFTRLTAGCKWKRKRGLWFLPSCSGTVIRQAASPAARPLVGCGQMLITTGGAGAGEGGKGKLKKRASR
ncbi:hypothetical protein MPTK1_4g21310 [Marchantia polymorpha subsp. ruderalis]|uniref:Uncharacterized protein n=2 Tax=Marchantia polymorpha TaxID=3197 RepID=A0AAF6BC95_MARPO|nr:hypothetical protein MARPO_0090s0090 [Marchantia polymorpha]BBN09629.1 hypothetical protein Mp_4g21310 [Marchantia polymorpha subsp. ruderalis]|eukprot:PTQ33357.1 hypothetical protein MARPO_0090s0090 [Marchantia polymorpha]